MRRIVLLVFATLTINAFGQISNLKTGIPDHSNKFENAENDTIPQVSYVNTVNSERTPAYYINGKPINGIILKTINPMHIESINVVKQDIEIEGTKYYGQIYIQLKPDYNPKLVSLTDLKLKVTNLKNTSSIFMIDHEIISGDYRKCFVDEKYILNIMVEKIVNKQENLQVNIIRLMTKTEENIKKSKEIRIRGTAD